MRNSEDIVVREAPDVDPGEVWDFYVENFCCETRYGKERVTSVLSKSDVIVTAQDNGRLVGLARAISDGLDAQVMELSVALSHQGPGATNETGALIEDDIWAVGRRLGQVLVDALLSRGVCFIESNVYRTEVDAYMKAGFSVKHDCVDMLIDRRPPWKFGGDDQ